MAIWNASRGVPPADEMAGFNVLGTDGHPGLVYDTLRTALTARWQWLWPRWFDSVTRIQTDPVSILAPDEVVHLGDND